MALLALAVVLAASVLGVSSAEPLPCAGSLPRGPSVPEPVVFKNSCGGFLLQRDGRVSRLRADWLAARSGETERTYGADLRLVRGRSGRIFVRRAGQLVWRSRELYLRDAGAVVFGPGSFAFGSWKHGIYLTDLHGPERLVVHGSGLAPIAFRHGGTLLVAGSSLRPSILVLSPDGSLLQRYPYRAQNGYAYDARTESLFFVTPERMLVRLDGMRLRPVRRVQRRDRWIALVGPYVSISAGAHRGASDELGFTVLERDGRLVSRWRWLSPRRSRIDYTPVASADGRAIAFRTVTEGQRPRVVVHVLRAGETRPTAVLHHHGRQVGCGVGASFTWRGSRLLYSATDGPAAIVDTGTGRSRSLSKLGARIPHRWRGERPYVYWLRDARL
jgi:hypothetical protein